MMILGHDDIGYLAEIRFQLSSWDVTTSIMLSETTASKRKGDL